MKLEKGTKVRVTAKEHGHDFNIGDELTIIEFNAADSYGSHYDCSNGDETWALCETEFEVIPDEVKPKIDIEYWRYKFAGMAMQGMFANSTVYFNINNKDMVVSNAARYADLLIKELQKEKQ